MKGEQKKSTVKNGQYAQGGMTPVRNENGIKKESTTRGRAGEEDVKDWRRQQEELGKNECLHGEGPGD